MRKNTRKGNSNYILLGCKIIENILLLNKIIKQKRKGKEGGEEGYKTEITSNYENKSQLLY